MKLRLFFLLLLLLVPATVSAGAKPCPPYDRNLYRHWTDDDRDGINTRHEVLQSESEIPVDFDRDGRKVVYGRWYDAYTDSFTTNPRELHIDHLVPLREAHYSGACHWSSARKRAYANDLQLRDALIAVSGRENMRKGARDPAEWLPQPREFHCEYVRMWRAVKEKWNLTMDWAERNAVEDVERHCH